MAIEATLMVGYDVGAELLAALNIKDKYVKGFTLRCYTDEVVTITVEHFVNRDVWDGLFTYLKTDVYEILKRTDPDVPTSSSTTEWSPIGKPDDEKTLDAERS